MQGAYDVYVTNYMRFCAYEHKKYAEVFVGEWHHVPSDQLQGESHYRNMPPQKTEKAKLVYRYMAHYAATYVKPSHGCSSGAIRHNPFIPCMIIMKFWPNPLSDSSTPQAH